MWESEPRLYLLPWTALVALVAAIPLIREALRPRGFDAFSPVVFAVLSHLIPAFVMGGLIVAAGWRPWFFFRIPDPDRTLPLTMFYTSVGFSALTLGFFLPSGRRAGRRLAAWAPAWHWQPHEVVVPALGLLAIAGGLTTLALQSGLVGYQQAGTIGEFDAAIVIAANTVGSTAAALLWLAIFGTKQPSALTRLAVVALAGWMTADLLVSGRRGALFQSIVLAAGAFWLSGRRVRLRHALGIGAIVLVAIFAGMAYGTTFRLVKGSAARVELAAYPRLAGETLRVIADRGVGGNVTFVFGHLAERMELVTSAGVVVANYERLAPFEPALGLSNSILSSLTSALIPRFLWPNKPGTADGKVFGELYFGYPNSFAITVGADLLRNFGPWSIPVGMALLGWLLRVMYATLVEDLPRSIWRVAGYLVLLTTISYEGSFGQNVPYLIRTAFVLGMCLLLVEGYRRLRGVNQQS
jgi:hypothetical protein